MKISPPPVMMWNPTGGAPSPRAAAAAAVACLLVTGTLVTHVGHPINGEPPEPAAASGKLFSAYFRMLTRERRAMRVPSRRSSNPEPVEHLSPSDLFIAVTSTQRFHRERLELLLDTWISRSAQQVSTEARTKCFCPNYFIFDLLPAGQHYYTINLCKGWNPEAKGNTWT